MFNSPKKRTCVLLVWQLAVADAITRHGQGAAPILYSRFYVPRHSPGGLAAVARQQGLHDGQMLASLAGQAAVVVARGDIGPSHIAKGAKQGLEPAQLGRQ